MPRTFWNIYHLAASISCLHCCHKSCKVILSVIRTGTKVGDTYRITWTSYRIGNFFYLQEVNTISQAIGTTALNLDPVAFLKRLVQQKVNLIKSETANTSIRSIRRIAAGKILPHPIRV